jgi:hypothetical protein
MSNASSRLVEERLGINLSLNVDEEDLRPLPGKGLLKFLVGVAVGVEGVEILLGGEDNP